MLLSLEVNAESKPSWTRARSAAKKLLADCETWDKAMRELLCDKQTLKRCNSASLRLLPHRRSRPLCHTFRAFRHKQDSTLVAEQTAISSIFAFFVSIYSVFVERPG